MLTRKCRRIATITSIIGKTGYRGFSGNSLVKAVLDGFTTAITRELGQRGITTDAIETGFLLTEMTHGLSNDQQQQITRRIPVGRLGLSEDVAPLVTFLCSDARLRSLVVKRSTSIEG
jgi:3-oxoacyl-[acyl-carrier protein] reductase